MESTRTQDIIDPSLRGYSSINQDVSIFDFGNVIVTKNYKENDRVRLVSGGSSCHIEYVGKGMLTASIQGLQNDSPTPNLILRVLRELSLNHVKGILIIVQASTTDILNFGLAVERAINDDLRVMFLGVSEVCQNKEFTKANKRGLSGVILVNKIAGALSEMDKSLSYIYEYCSKVIENISSSAVKINTKMVMPECFYCKKCSHKIENGSEPKLKKFKELKVTDILPKIVEGLVSDITKDEKLKFCPGDTVILLVNNIGAMNKREEFFFVKETVALLTFYDINIARFYIGYFLSVNCNIDLSFTLLKVFDREVLNHLDASCSVPGWKSVYQNACPLSLDHTIFGCLKRKCRLSPPIKGPKLRDRPTNVMQLSLQFACDALISCEKMLNRIDSEKGDGDTGTRLKNLAQVLHKRVCNKKLIIAYPFTFFLSLSKILENAVGSTMGRIYSILFEAAANKFGEYKEEDDVTPLMWVEALENACNAVKKYSNVEVGDKTMYDPLYACTRTVKKYLSDNDKKFITAFGLGVAKAEEAAQNTRKPGCKYPDSGAHAVGIWMRAVHEGVKLRCCE